MRQMILQVCSVVSKAFDPFRGGVEFAISYFFVSAANPGSGEKRKSRTPRGKEAPANSGLNSNMDGTYWNSSKEGYEEEKEKKKKEAEQQTQGGKAKRARAPKKGTKQGKSSAGGKKTKKGDIKEEEEGEEGGDGEKGTGNKNEGDLKGATTQTMSYTPNDGKTVCSVSINVHFHNK
jgi:hypothetical protein